MFGSFWDLLGLAFGMFWLVLCCDVWIAAECVGLFGRLLGCLGLYRVVWECLSFLLVCREIAKIIKSVMAITELKKNGSKKEIQARSLWDCVKCFELLGYLLAVTLPLLC